VRNVLGVFLSLCAVACASPPAKPDDTSVASVCTREWPTGSLFPVTRCRTAEEAERDKEAVREAGDAINRSRSGLRGPNTP
jgi:hypothetical protein